MKLYVPNNTECIILVGTIAAMHCLREFAVQQLEQLENNPMDAFDGYVGLS
jgi:hypothetical protein